MADTSEEHPLTARVLVNQIWMRLFGEGLVRTPEDLGFKASNQRIPNFWIGWPCSFRKTDGISST